MNRSVIITVMNKDENHFDCPMNCTIATKKSGEQKEELPSKFQEEKADNIVNVQVHRKQEIDIVIQQNYIQNNELPKVD